MKDTQTPPNYSDYTDGSGVDSDLQLSAESNDWNANQKAPIVRTKNKWLAIVTLVVIAVIIIVVVIAVLPEESVEFSAADRFDFSDVLSFTASPTESQDSTSVPSQIPKAVDDVTQGPTTATSSIPTNTPILSSTQIPTETPQTEPTGHPTHSTSDGPTLMATGEATLVASHQSTLLTSESPIQALTRAPTEMPSRTPTGLSTEDPSESQTAVPSSRPSETTLLYRPGDLASFQEGLLLSTGLSARIVARVGETVSYQDGSKSSIPFHGRPDGGTTFADSRPENEGGWVYVGNSEMAEIGQGGVGAITFNKQGETIDYKMILNGTTMNCSGGKTPWNTWVSCEETLGGVIFQVDPFGNRPAQQLTLGNAGGFWESFAYDIRNLEVPRFFATEDQTKGALRRFTPHPDNVDWTNDPWTMLHGSGEIEFLVLNPDRTGDKGTYQWTANLRAAETNTILYYPQSEGIDVFGNQLYFVTKKRKELFVLNLDDGTYWKQSTVSGIFDGMPDQMQRILGNDEDLLYFTEEGGRDNGVHARDSEGRFYTIFESPVYSDETTGLAFSPDGMHLYVAYQNTGLMFDIYRQDGLPFHARKLDVKHHAIL